MTDTPAATSECTYFAFVSYSHKDEKWAKWIQDALESYRLPAAVRKEAGKPLPQRIRPVFRDATDLGVGKLVDNLRRELEQSRFLIVVCSPHSARPNEQGKHWVDQEVERFCELGRADRIIPVIVGGTKETAYCPKLAEEDILGLDATKQPRERILNDLVAKILGLRPDELWRREERRRRARRRGRILGATLAAAVLTFGGFLAWDATRTVTNYYADYVDSFGLPEGIFPLEKADLAHRHHHYRFEYRGLQSADSPHADSAERSVWNALGFRRRLVRVVQANSRGYPCDGTYTERPPIQDFSYDGTRLHTIRHGRFTGDGREPHLDTRVEFHTENSVINGLLKLFSAESQLSVAYAESSPILDSDRTDFRTKTQIVQYLLQRDDKGRPRQRFFLNPSGQYVANGDGFWGFAYEYDDWGRTTAQWYLGREGDAYPRRASKKGIAGQRYKYAGQHLQRIEYVDENGLLVFGPNGWMICERSFDDSGNISGGRYLDVREREIPCTDGYVKWCCEYDEAGNETKRTYFGSDGKPTLIKDGFSEMHCDYDSHGNMTTQTYFDVNGELTLNKNGYAEKRCEYDERGNLIKASFFGSDKQPTLCMDGYAGIGWEIDECGNTTKELYFGVDGHPTVNKDGIAEVRWEYDNRGNVTMTSFFGVDGKPTLVDGIAGVRWRHDERGNVTRSSYFDVDGKAALKDGFGEGLLEYDERGNLIKLSYFGMDGRLTPCKEGYSVACWDYDGRGNKTKIAFFGADGKPTQFLDGYAEMRSEYDAHGNTTKKAYFGVDGKPTLGPEGCAELRFEYDERGNMTQEACFGVNGMLTLCSDDYAERHCEYDKRGNLTEVAIFGVDRKPVLNTDGVAKTRFEYDERDNPTKMQFFGVDGRPTYMDGCAEARWEYDGRGNLTREAYFGVDGKATLLGDGYAEVRSEYNERWHMVRQAFFGVDGKPTLCVDGYAEKRYEHDERGNMTKLAFFGVDGKPTLHKDGYAEVRFDGNDDYGDVAYFGLHGEPVAPPPPEDNY